VKAKPLAVLRIALAATIVSLAAQTAWGQPPRDGEREWRGRGPMPELGGPDGMDPRELLEQVMMARISKDLRLDDEQTVILVRQFTEHRDEMRQMHHRRMELLRELRGVLNEGGESEAELEARLEALQAHEDAMHAARGAFFERAAEGLTVRQRAGLYVFIHEFEGDMRRLMQRARERHRDADDEARPGRPGPPQFRGRGPGRGEQEDAGAGNGDGAAEQAGPAQGAAE
jgi:hypothetical protein